MKNELLNVRENSMMIIEKINQLDPYDQLRYCEGDGGKMGKGGDCGEKGAIGVLDGQAISKINVVPPVESGEIDVPDHFEQLCKENDADMKKKRKQQASRQS